MRTADENNRSLSGSDSGMTDTHLHHSTPAGRADFWFARWALRLMDGLTGATLGALFYGGWGVFANSAHGAAIAVRAGCAPASWMQGSRQDGECMMVGPSGALRKSLLRNSKV